MSDYFGSFLTPLPPNVQFLPSKVRFLGSFQTPLPPKIGHDLWTLPNLFRYYNHDSPGDEHTRRRVVCAAVTVSNIDSTKCDELMGEE